MQTYTIKHRLQKNLPSGTIYNSQVATIIFAVGMAFKLSSAPGLVSTRYGSSTTWLFLIYTSIEAICLFAVLAFARKNGDSFLVGQNSITYRILCGMLSLLMTLKATFYFCYSASYLTHELFSGVEPYLVYVMFLVPVVYLGVKGMRTIARCCEIFSVLFFVIILLNLVFLDTDLDIGRNLPVFSMPPKDFFAQMPRYGLWLGDFLPFAFIRIRNKKLPYISCSVAITWTLVNVIVMLGVAIYGDALKMVADLLIHIAAYNQLSLEIGRMEWTNLFAMLIMSIFAMSFLFSGAIDACERAIKTKLPAKLAFPLALACSAIFVPSARTVTNFSMQWFGYVLFAASVFLPFALLATLYGVKRRYAGWYAHFDEEYVVAHATPSLPDSLADGILQGFKDSAKDEETVMPNGTLQPKEDGQ